MGRVPKLISPNLDKCIIQCNYGKMCGRFPITVPSEISSGHSSKMPISQDSIAKTLAEKHSADVIISFSSLKHLLKCRSLNCDTSLELPVTVTSFPSIDATNCSVKRIFIDKAIPAGIWHPSRKNLVYHKYGAKLQFTHCKPSKARRITQSFCWGIEGEKHHNREIIKLQDGCFETDNFLHETFGQISCSPVKSNLTTEADTEKDGKTFDPVHNAKEEDKAAQVLNNNLTSTLVSNEESLIANGLNKTPKMEFGKDKSDQYCNYLNKENELSLKDASVTNNGTRDILSEEKCSSRISCTAATCHSNTGNILKNQNTVNSSPDSVLHSYLEQSKECNANVEETKISDESTFEESPKCKKRKRMTKTTVIYPGRRVTRSQTKKLEEEDTMKHSVSSNMLDFECETEKINETIKIKQNENFQIEITEQSLVQQDKNNNQHSEKEAIQTEGLKLVRKEVIQSATKENIRKETELLENEFSNDSFPRSILRRPKLLSSDDDSDDNLVIDENALSTDNKQRELSQSFNCCELNTSGNITVNTLNIEEPSHSNISSQLQGERMNIQDTSKKINVTQSEGIQSISIDKVGNENSKLSSEEKKDSGSTLDQILHLQEEMLKPKNKVLPNVIEQTSQVSSGPQPGLPTYLEDASQFPLLDPSLNANSQYSLWNMGQLKVIMRSKLDSRKPNSVPCFIFSKLEYQSQFGGEVCSEHELLCQWFTLLCHPGSVGLRVRIHACTSKVLMIEHLTLPEMHNLVAKLSPEKPLCWILNVFEKLKGLPDGQYLLAHQKKEDVITVYTATDGSKRGDFDLHTAIRQRLVAVDNNSDLRSVDSKAEVPWLPIDPDVMLPSLICNNRIPATFPPVKEGETLPKGKRKKSKKKFKVTKMKAKLQKI